MLVLHCLSPTSPCRHTCCCSASRSPPDHPPTPLAIPIQTLQMLLSSLLCGAQFAMDKTVLATHDLTASLGLLKSLGRLDQYVLTHVCCTTCLHVSTCLATQHGVYARDIRSCPYKHCLSLHQTLSMRAVCNGYNGFGDARPDCEPRSPEVLYPPTRLAIPIQTLQTLL